jgi:polysaccharide deacetylase 2 family uncharacterized protein YibQ
MAADDLTKPLGLPTAGKTNRQWLVFGAGGAAAAVIAIAAVLWFSRNTGPTATAAITAPSPGTISLADRTGSVPPSGEALTELGGPGLTEVEPAPGGLSELGKVIIYDPSARPRMQLAALPDSALLEMTDDGPLPRIGDDGRRPLEVYARPNDADPRDVAIAIVVGGIGIDPDGTRRAIGDLPGEMTLALAPYADGLDQTVTAARSAGHEILLQIPLEPYSYPQVDPGPQTLTTGASAAENRDRLHWLLGRAASYIGVVNYMGARFTSESPSLTPVLEEIGGRGLLYLDDGSSPLSIVPTVAPGRVPFLRADLVLDADPAPAAIDARLRQLQEIARLRGRAIATATAFPATIDRLIAYAKSAAGRNITLVPLSALVAGQGE